MFVLGHDACHQSLTPSRRLNIFLGRVLFLPTLTASSLWIAGHNIAHHGHPGLRFHDVPWVPLSPSQYFALSASRRWLYRVYRSWWGGGLYFALDVWWKRQMFPRGKTRRVFVWDSCLVTAFLGFQVSVYCIIALQTGQSPVLLIALGVVLPFVVWLHLAAFVFYVHHTDPSARWYDDKGEWRSAQPNLEGTHSITLPLRLDVLLHHVMEHPAHHVNAAIPSYHLAAAQRALEKCYPEDFVQRHITIRRFIEITRRCELYDGKGHQWLTFSKVESMASVAGNAHIATTTS